MMTTATTYDVVIGLEVHAQLFTRTKIFCSCPTEFGAAPNTHVCAVCMGLPGVLPVLNRQAFELGLRAIVALKGHVSPRAKFDRKNYFYPDLPKNYQISQYDEPIGTGGCVEIETPDGIKTIHLTRIHLEEDAGKLIHEAKGSSSFVDFNRAGVPLAEIVSEPEIKTPEEAHTYLTNLKAILKAIGVSQVNMEMGHLRCDANVSLRRSPQDPFGTKVELKNLNSFKYVRDALHYEIERQSGQLDNGETILQETRLYDPKIGRSMSMRLKEDAHDYRYFPEPDLVPFEVGRDWVARIHDEMPALPKERRSRFMQAHGLQNKDTDFILQDEGILALFESLAKVYENTKTIANWLSGPISAYLNENRIDSRKLQLDTPKFVDLLKMIDGGKVSLKAAREDIFPEFMKTGKSPSVIADEKQLGQISDLSALDTVMDEVLAKNEKSVVDFKAGKEPALMFLVGQVMRQTKGKANPQMVNKALRKKLKGE